MMRKIYLAPQTAVVTTELVTMVCTSGVGGNGSDDEPGGDIGYGGVDDDGTKDPSSRRRRDVWDDDEEQDY